MDMGTSRETDPSTSADALEFQVPYTSMKARRTWFRDGAVANAKHTREIIET